MVQGLYGSCFVGPVASCWAAHSKITKIIGFTIGGVLSLINLFIESAPPLRNSSMQISLAFYNCIMCLYSSLFAFIFYCHLIVCNLYHM